MDVNLPKKFFGLSNNAHQMSIRLSCHKILRISRIMTIFNLSMCGLLQAIYHSVTSFSSIQIYFIYDNLRHIIICLVYMANI